MRRNEAIINIIYYSESESESESESGSCMNLPSISTQGMLAILDHSFPLSLLHSVFSFGHLEMINCKSEDGRPTSGKDVRFGQSSIIKYSREVRFSISAISQATDELRVVGSIITFSSEEHSAS